MLELPPNPAWRLVPRMPMKMSGNAKSATIRWRSRSSLMKSRCASARMAEASLTCLTHDLQVCVLEARRVRLHDAERSFDASQDRVDGVAVELHLERGAAARRVAEPGELVAERRTVGRVDEDVLLDEIALDVVGRTERHDLALVDDADAVRFLCLLEVVGGQEDRRPARPPHLAEVLPERATSRNIEAGRRLVEKEDLRVVQEAAHDLELASHPARERLDRLVDVARDAQKLGELLDLRAVAASHQRVGRRVRKDAVENGVEAHILLGREVLVEARPLEDDPDLPAHGARLADDVAAVDRRATARWGKRRGQDRDRRGLSGSVRAEQHEEFTGLHLERDAVDGIRLGLLVPLHEVFDADHP